MDATRLLIVGQADPIHVGSHLAHAAATLPIETEMCDVADAYAGPAWRRRAAWWIGGRRPVRLDAFSQHVLDVVKRFQPTVVLTTGIAPVRAAALDALGKMGVVRANFLTDDPWNPAHRAPWFFEALGHYDHVFSPRQANLPDLQRAGPASVHYLPFAYDPAVHFVEPPAPAEAARYRADVMLAGGGDRDRVAVVSALMRAGFAVATYGGYWDRFAETAASARGRLDAAGLRRATSEARVSLGLVRRANRDGHAMRSFEVPAMGGCLLAEDTDEHRAMFGPDGDAVLYFTTASDAVGQVVRLVADAGLRQSLAGRVHARVTSGGHTYRDRLMTLLALASETHAQDRDSCSGPFSRI